MSADGLFVIGATHHRAPLAVREKLSLGAEAVAALQAEFSAMAGLREFAMLSTCNRVEFYGVASSADAAMRITAAFCARQNFDPGEFAKICLDLRGRAAVQHLVEVSAGPDSGQPHLLAGCAASGSDACSPQMADQ